MTATPSTRRALAAAAGCAALAAALLWPALTPKAADRRMIGGPGEDFARQVVPWRTFVADAWASGAVPLWNPHQYAGTPVLADPQQAVLYPWRLLQAPLAIGARRLPLGSVTLEAVAHLALGAAFALALARRLGAAPAAAALAAVAFGAGGYLTGYPVVQLAVLDTAVWLPATLAALVAAAQAADDRARRRAAVAAAVATALAVFAGHPQTAGYVVGTGALWLAAAALRTRRGAPIGPTAADVARIGAIWLGGAAALSAVQWWPTLELARQASRTLGVDEVLAGLPPRDVVQLVAPHVVSRWSPLYVGIVPLVVALWGGVRARQGRGWLVLALGAWLFALGGNGPLFPVLARLIPALALFRHQERAVVVVSLALALAAALSLGAAVARRREVGGVFGALAAAAAAAALAAQLRFAAPEAADALAFTAFIAAAAAVVCRAPARFPAPRAAIALVALAAFDLLSVNRGHALGPVDAAALDPAADPRAAALLPHARDGRVSSEGRLAAGPNAASVLGLFDVTGDSPLHLAQVETLVTTTPELAWWKILGVRYVVTEPRAGAEALLSPLLGAGGSAGPTADMTAAAGAGAAFAVRLPGRLTWVVPRLEVRPPGWAPPADFDPFALGTVDALPDPLPDVPARLVGWADVPADLAALAATPGEARLVGLEGGRAVVDVAAAGDAVVALSTAAGAPGDWRARVTTWARRDDAAEARRRTVDAQPFVLYGAILGVRVGDGVSRIEWTYRPRSVTLGALVSSLGLVGLAALWGVDRWRERRRTPGAR